MFIHVQHPSFPRQHPQNHWKKGVHIKPKQRSWGKLSTSMSIMGICCFGCLMFLAEQLLNNPELLQNLVETWGNIFSQVEGVEAQNRFGNWNRERLWHWSRTSVFAWEKMGVYIDPHVKDVYIEDTSVLYLCRICVSDTVFLIFILTHADRHPSNDTMHNCTYTYYNVIIIYTSSLISYTFAVGFGPIKCKLLTLVMPGASWGFKHVHSSSLGVEHVPMCHLF